MSKDYKTLNEKQSYFRVRKTICTVTELLLELEKYQNARYVFRGQSNAFWKIRSSALRWWQDARCAKCCKVTDYHEFVAKALGWTKKPEFPQLHLKCEMNRKNAWFGDHERLGFLQHYSYPTPLIDFTNDYRVALYMALRSGMQKGEYFSVYILDANTRLDNEIYSLEKLVEKYADGVDEKQYLSSFYQGGLRVPKSGWCQFSCILIHKDGRLWCPYIAKERIASQGGLFVYMGTEQALEEQMSEYRRREKTFEDTDALNTQPLICLDVPYSLADALREMLIEEGYTDGSMGFADMSLDSIAKGCFESFVNSIM